MGQHQNVAWLDLPTVGPRYDPTGGPKENPKCKTAVLTLAFRFLTDLFEATLSELHVLVLLGRHASERGYEALGIG
jgi:hypothetical protein